MAINPSINVLRTRLSNYNPTLVQNSPADTATVLTTTPTLNFTGTNIDSQTIEYEVQVDTVNTFDSIQSTPAFVQSAKGLNASGASPNVSTAAFASPNTAGNAIIVGVYNDNTSANLLEVSDTAGNIYKKLVVVGTPTVTAIYIAHNIKAKTGNVVTAFTGNNDGGIVANEYSGLALVDAFDQSATGSGTTTSLATAASATTTLANELVFVSAERDWTTPDALSVGAGYGNFVTQVSNFTEGAIEDKVISAIGAQTGAMTASTNNSNTWNIALTTFKASYSPKIDKFSASDAGFTAGHPFASASAVDYTIQAGDALTNGVTYYWRVRGRSPSGLDNYGDWSSTRSFTVNTVTAPSVAAWAEPVNQFLKNRVLKRQQVNRIQPLPPLGPQAPYTPYWIQEVNQPYKYRVKRQQPNSYKTPFPAKPSQAPYVPYWKQPVNEPLKSRVPKRQIPGKYQPPYPPLGSQAPYLSYWYKPTNQPLRNRIRPRQQPKYPFQIFNFEEVLIDISGWVKPVNQFLKNRVLKRTQVNKANPPYPPIASQAPYVSYWKQPINQFLKSRTPKRTQVNKYQPSWPPSGSQAPYLSYWAHSTNQPLRRKPRPQQPPSTSQNSFYSIIASTIPSVASWVHPVNQFLKSRVLKRQQVNKAQPSYPTAPSQAPYISYWIHPVNEPLRSRVLKRQQPRYNPAVLPPGSLVVPPLESWQRPTNQPLKNRVPKRQLVAPKLNPIYHVSAVVAPILSSWVHPLQQFLRSRVLKRQQPNYTIDRGHYLPIPNPPIDFGASGIIISSTDQLGTLVDITSINIPGSDTISIITDSSSRTSSAGEDSSLTIDDPSQDTTLQG